MLRQSQSGMGRKAVAQGYSSRRSILANTAAGIALGALGVSAQAQSEIILRPEDFGASGDGIAPDGPALARMIEAANKIAPSQRLTLLCRGRYLMRAAPPRPMGPAKHAERPGDVVGLPALTRNDVTVDARGAYFLVPAENHFRRIVRGGSTDDAFFVGWHFIGDRCSLIGGTLDGNLGQRPIKRGPKPMGFGGADFGLIMEGEGWRLEGVTSKNWGTDCLLITGPGRSISGIYSGARRNCVSVVANRKILQSNPVVIEAGRVEHAADWPDDVYNNPGAGIVVEAGRYAPAQATVHILGHESADVQISQVVGPNEPIQIANNRCACSKRRFINHRRSLVENTHEWQATALSENEFNISFPPK